MAIFNNTKTKLSFREQSQLGNNKIKAKSQWSLEKRYNILAPLQTVTVTGDDSGISLLLCKPNDFVSIDDDGEYKV